MLTPVLLSGGVGSRLWPVSRESHPKQFLPLAGELTMLQETLQRTAGLEASPPIIVCSATMKRCSSLQTTIGGAASRPEVRRRVSCNMLCSPAMARNCFGWDPLETGHNLLPTPPERRTGVSIRIPCSLANHYELRCLQANLAGKHTAAHGIGRLYFWPVNRWTCVSELLK